MLLFQGIQPERASLQLLLFCSCCVLAIEAHQDVASISRALSRRSLGGLYFAGASHPLFVRVSLYMCVGVRMCLCVCVGGLQLWETFMSVNLFESNSKLLNFFGPKL